MLLSGKKIFITAAGQGIGRAITEKFIKEKIDSGQWFIEAIQQRRVTMVNVMYSIIKFQVEYPVISGIW